MPRSLRSGLVGDRPKIGGGQFADDFHAGFMDGVVRFLYNRIDEATLRALITRNGGEVVDFEEFEQR
ncbi:MAG: hypothetical protein EXR98_19685 [Gemmataceae bacterium]|nr:hypothetical protein [Gemmataceae bacterium]